MAPRTFDFSLCALEWEYMRSRRIEKVWFDRVFETSMKVVDILICVTLWKDWSIFDLLIIHTNHLFTVSNQFNYSFLITECFAPINLLSLEMLCGTGAFMLNTTSFIQHLLIQKCWKTWSKSCKNWISYSLDVWTQYLCLEPINTATQNS